MANDMINKYMVSVLQDMCMFRSARYEQIKAAGLTAPEAGVVHKIVGLP